MIALSLQAIAQALEGDVTAGQVVAPGPNHSRRDRSLAVRPSSRARDGLVIHSFAGDDWRNCRDYVAGRLGIVPDKVQVDRRPASPPDATRMERAQALWKEARDPADTVVERYLASRMLDLPPHAAGETIRFHPRCPWKDEASGLTLRVPAMIAAMRSLTSREVTAVHRTRLTDDGRKVDRRMLGIAAGSAIMLDPLTGPELTTGEGIETCLSGGAFGLGPVWALASAGAIAAFPLLTGVERLTILAERDEASETATTACHGRWTDGGRAVRVVLPNLGKDMNDAWRAMHAR